MKHVFAWLMAFALTSPHLTRAEGQMMTQDQQDVHAAVQAMTEAFQSNDIAQVMLSYEKQATVMFEPNVPISDALQLEQMFSGMAMVKPVFEYPAGHEVIVSGDIALHISPWNMTGMSPDGQDIAQSGLSVAVLRKQSDGSWRMVIDNPHGGRLIAENQ